MKSLSVLVFLFFIGSVLARERTLPDTSQIREWEEQFADSTPETIDKLVCELLYHLPKRPWPERLKALLFAIIDKYHSEGKRSKLPPSGCREGVEEEMAGWQEDARFVPFLMESLGGGFLYVQALALIGEPAFQPVVEALYRDGWAVTQGAAAQTLELMFRHKWPFMQDEENKRRMRQGLIHVIQQEDDWARSRAMRALAYVEGPTGPRIRHLNSPRFKGTHEAALRIMRDLQEYLICFWKYEHSPRYSAGYSRFDVYENSASPVSKDTRTFFAADDFDSGHLDSDDIMDFVIAGSGRNNRGEFRHIIVVYLTGNGRVSQRKFRAYDSKRNIEHVAIGDIDGDGKQEIVFTEVLEVYDDWENLEIKTGQLDSDEGTLHIRNTGVVNNAHSHWSELNLGDVDNDGKDEAIISVNDRAEIYKLDDSTSRPVHAFRRKHWHSTLTVNNSGQILELYDDTLSVRDVSDGFVKTVPKPMPGIDFSQWRPIRVSIAENEAMVVISKPVNGRDISRQITIYDY